MIDFETLADDEQSDDSGDYYQAKIKRLNETISSLHSELKRVYELLDVDADTFLVNIKAGIIDMASAARAIETYNIDWFRRLEYSPFVLIRVAQILKHTVGGYMKFTNFWTDLAEGEFACLKLSNYDDEDQEVDFTTPITRLGEGYIPDDSMFGDAQAAPKET